MVSHIDHFTVVVRDIDKAKEFFGLHPDPIPDPHITDLQKIGYNHVCFAVDDIEKELKRLKDKDVKVRNDIMEFHDRRLVYLVGPENITVELAEWVR